MKLGQGLFEVNLNEPERKLPKYLRSENGDTQSEQAEAMTLYAEYAIDFAVQAARHALLAVLSAIDLQMDCEEAEKAMAKA